MSQQHIDGKIPPQDTVMEEAILGALLLEKDSFSEIANIIRPESFYKEEHSEIFKAIQELFAGSRPIDLFTVRAELQKRNKLEFIGGAYFLTKLTDRVASAANIEHHARIVAEKFIQREVIRISTVLHRDAYNAGTDAFDLLDKAEDLIASIRFNSQKGKGSQTFSTVIQREVKERKEAVKKPKDLTGVPTGNSKLDKLTNGFQKTDLIIEAARPGMGKTTRALGFAKAAAKAGKKVAIFSLEMSAQQLVRKFIIEESSVWGNKFLENTLTDNDFKLIDAAAARLMKLPIHIFDEPGINPMEMKAGCRRFKKMMGGIDFAVVDYLQLMNSHEKNNNREQDVASITRNLKRIAKELEIPVLALSQLTRDVEKRPGSKRPQMSDLRESGSIEQDADMVMFLYRPAYYFPYGKGPVNGQPEEVYAEHNIKEAEYNMISEILIEKFRGGKPDRAIIEYFNGPLSRFSESYHQDTQIDIFDGTNETTDDLPF